MREHLVVLGLWPYLVLRAAGDNTAKVGLGLRVFLGLWLGFTLLFKYFYSIVVFLVEATDALVSRKLVLLFRIECIVAGAIVFAYLFMPFRFLKINRKQTTHLVLILLGCLGVSTPLKAVETITLSEKPLISRQILFGNPAPIWT